MSLFNKIFGNKTDTKNAQIETPDDNNFRILSSIYPYFKQMNASQGESIELPEDIANIDKTKVYNLPSIKLVINNICEDLNCLYAIDNEYGYEIIQENRLKELNLTEDNLHEIALANFRKLLSTNLKAHGDSSAMMFTINGNLEASLILVDEIWDQVENHIGEQIVIAVPSRDVIVATGKSNRKMIDTFSEKAKIILGSGDHPLSKNWFIRNNKKWELFEKIME